MRIIGYTISMEHGIHNSLGQHCTSPPYLDFLLEQYENSIKVFADLDADVAQLLALIKLSPKELEKLVEQKELYISTNDSVKPYILNYIPSKWFSIDKGYGKGHKYAGFSDVSQYNEKLAKDWTNPLVPYSSYLQIRAQEAKKTGEEVYQVFVELGLHPLSLVSPANVYRKEVISKLDLPSFDDIPVEAMEIAYECCKGNWVEAFQIGHWDKVYDYDINSAYPYQASLLPDLRLGTWKRSREYEPTASLGYTRCEVMIDQEFSPIILQFDDRNYTPKGVFYTSLTKKEIDFIDHCKLGYATVVDGYWWTGNGVNSHPLEAPIKHLYKVKQEATGLKREIIKRIMAGSFYGLFLETRGEDFGEYFMSPWATEIETRTRLEIADICLRSKVVPLHISVDGVIVDNALNLPDDYVQDTEMGCWRLEHSSKCIIASSGLVALETKYGSKDFSVNYEWLVEQISKHPETETYSMKKRTVLTLAQAKNLKRITDVGKTEEIEKTISLGDTKRFYKQIPKDFGDLMKHQYQSEAWSANMLKILEEGDIK